MRLPLVSHSDMKKLSWLALLMGIAILGITGFQLYWLKNNYDREKQSLELQTSAAFRQTILRLQAAKMKLETVRFETDHSFPGSPVFDAGGESADSRKHLVKKVGKEPPITMINLLQEKMKDDRNDSLKRNISIAARIPGDSLIGRDGQKLKGTVRSITISTTTDSPIHIDPSMIRDKAIDDRKNNGEKKNGKMVAIGYDGKNIDTIFTTKTSRDSQKWVTGTDAEDIVRQNGKISLRGKDAVFRFLYNIDSISVHDTITIKEIGTAFAKRLKDNNMDLSFAVSRIDSNYTDTASLNDVTIGFATPITYRLELSNKMSYLLKKLLMPILFSLLLVGITVISFVSLYRNLIRQKRLAELKNQFISNITHELKTPIATVGVAIEALKNFNAIHDPQRTQEYLDISQNELQRLSLLVDKVLKLSMFEKKEIELKYEYFDLKSLVDEVVSSMKLQIEKYHAIVSVQTEGNTSLQGDKLHLLSVIFNLLDNALKYGNGNIAVKFSLKEKADQLELSVSDNGIGIPPEYREKVFEKFFRVPAGDTHNTKGYGLGLSYVAHVIQKHNGKIEVESQQGLGTKFVITLPKQPA